MISEHVKGRWPFWISPRQVMVVPVNLDNVDYAYKVKKLIHDAGFYVDCDDGKNQFKKKIALAVDPKANLMYNYVFVVGKTEQEAGTVNIRARGTTKGSALVGEK